MSGDNPTPNPNPSYDLGNGNDALNNITQNRTSNFNIGAKADEYHDLGYFVPGLGTGMLAADAVTDAQKGDWGTAALDTGLAALDFVPYVGGTAAAAVKNAVKNAAKGTIKAVSKAVPDALKVGKREYPNLKPLGNKPIKLKDIDPEARGVKGLPKGPKNPKGGLVKAATNKGGFLKGALGGYLLNDALNTAGGVGGITDQQLAGAVSRTAAFQAGASSR